MPGVAQRPLNSRYWFIPGILDPASIPTTMLWGLLTGFEPQFLLVTNHVALEQIFSHVSALVSPSVQWGIDAFLAARQQEMKREDVCESKWLFLLRK